MTPTLIYCSCGRTLNLEPGSRMTCACGREHYAPNDPGQTEEARKLARLISEGDALADRYWREWR